MSEKITFSNIDLAVFCRQSLLVVKAGIPLSSGFDFFKSEGNLGDELTKATEKLFASVGEGSSFSDALAAYGGFPNHLVAMIKLGEQTGKLENSLLNLARYYELSERVREKTVSAVTYPLILLVIMSLVIIFLIVQVLPQFNEILSSMGGQMPWATALILGVGVFIKSYWLVLVVALIALVVAVVLFAGSDDGRKFLGKLIFMLPFSKGASQKLATARFCTGMSMALASGVDFAGAVTMTSTIMGNEHMREKLVEMKNMMDAGMGIAESAEKINLFPTVFVKLFNTAYKTGEIDDLLIRMSEYYEDSLENTLHKLTSIIEPTLVIILTMIVGVILFSVMLPIIDIMRFIG